MTYSAMLNDTISFSVSGESIVVRLEECHPAFIQKVLDYGSRLLNDRVNSAAKSARDAGEDFDKVDFANQLLADWKAGKVGRSGGSHLSPLEEATRHGVTLFLRNKMSFRKSDAEKQARKWTRAKADVVRLVITVQDGLTTEQINHIAPTRIEEGIAKVEQAIKADVESHLEALEGDEVEVSF